MIRAINMRDQMTFQTFLEDLGYDTRSYSGRSMYGKECLAITVEDITKAIWEIAYALGSENALAEDHHEEIPQPKGIRWDSMGLQYVIYWPNVPYTSDEIISSIEEDGDGEAEE